MPQSSTVTFLSYWRGLQYDPQKAPPRAAFDPGRLKSLIPQMMMLSSEENGYKFRLCGGFLTVLHGKNLKEHTFKSLFREPFHNPLRTSLRMARHRQQPLVLNITAPWFTSALFDEIDRPLFQNETLSVEICLCPLIGHDGQLDRFVGLYQTYGKSPSTTRGKVGEYSLLSSKILDTQCHLIAAHLQLVSVRGQLIA